MTLEEFKHNLTLLEVNIDFLKDRIETKNPYSVHALSYEHTFSKNTKTDVVGNTVSAISNYKKSYDENVEFLKYILKFINETIYPSFDKCEHGFVDNVLYDSPNLFLIAKKNKIDLDTAISRQERIKAKINVILSDYEL